MLLSSLNHKPEIDGTNFQSIKTSEFTQMFHKQSDIQSAPPHIQHITLGDSSNNYSIDNTPDSLYYPSPLLDIESDQLFLTADDNLVCTLLSNTI